MQSAIDERIKEGVMNKTSLSVHLHIRMKVKDMEALEREALELREPLSTYCRKKLTNNLKQE
ncbi:hypothetical protein N9483_07600 [Flavobacteriaceae bacterium]|nr:hypothetical protein [Flavobacteriaceae bacterium]